MVLGGGSKRAFEYETEVTRIGNAEDTRSIANYSMMYLDTFIEFILYEDILSHPMRSIIGSSLMSFLVKRAVL